MIERIPRKKVRLNEAASVPAFIKNLSYMIPVERSAVQILKRVKLDPIKFKGLDPMFVVQDMVQKCGLPPHIASQLELRTITFKDNRDITVLTTMGSNMFGENDIRLLFWGRTYISAEGVRATMDTVAGHKMTGLDQVDQINKPVVLSKQDIIDLIKTRQYIDAIDRLNERLQADQKDAWAWTEKGEILRILGKYHKSILCYQMARKLDGDNITAKDGMRKTDQDRKAHGDFY